MSVGELGLLVSLIVGVVTLYYAKRATDVSEKTLAYELRRDREQKQAVLEWASPRGREKTWHCMGRSIENIAWFETEVRNRGPAHALDIVWSASMGSESISVGNSPPYLLPYLDDRQFMVAVPLSPDGSPKRDVVKIQAAVSDDESRKTRQWCVRFDGDPNAKPDEWTLTDLDCTSLRPRRTTHGFVVTSLG